MTKNKKDKIAGVSIDKWLEAKVIETKEKVEQKKYKNKLIAFLDVLAIKQLIEDHKDGNEHIAIEKIEKIRTIVESSAYIVSKKESIDFLQISDSFVFISEPQKLISLLKLLSVVQIRIATEVHLLLRGAVTIGDAIIEDENRYIIGPAYIKAYQLQENDAIYPRIIVDNSVINAIKHRKEEKADYLEQDLDKEYFLDYIKVFMKHELFEKEVDMKVWLRRSNIFTIFSSRFRAYATSEEHNICQKYGWTIQYYTRKGVWENV